LRQRDYPLAPMVLGILVGGFADTSLRRALLTYSSDFSAMLSRPIGLVLLAFLLFTVITQVRAMLKKRREDRPW
jgi:putative tricarboxylic transport membrane protein